jgi:hypothetical protein
MLPPTTPRERITVTPIRTALLAAGALAAVPATASAATLAVPAACLPSNEIVGIAGSGFSPNETIPITGLATPVNGFSDATGTFSDTFLTPNRQSYTPQQVTLTATDPVNPAVTASVGFQVVKFGSNAPLSGRPSSKTTWRFAGFTGGGTIYGHFRFHGKTMRNYRFGKAQGACGTLVTRARRLPTKVRRGTWTLQVDTRKSYSPNTRPAFKTSFTIVRSFG